MQAQITGGRVKLTPPFRFLWHKIDEYSEKKKLRHKRIASFLEPIKRSKAIFGDVLHIIVV
jgi:hypothetical protein